MGTKSKLFSNTVSNGLQFGSRWLFNIALARNYSTQYGEFTFLYTLATLFSSIFSYGANLFHLYKANNDKNYIILYHSIMISGLFFLSAFFLLEVVNIFYNLSIYYYIIVLAFLLSTNQSIYTYLKGLGKFQEEAKAYFLFFIFFILLVLILFVLQPVLLLENIFLILIVLNFLPVIIGVFILKNENIFFNLKKGLLRLSIKTIKERWSYGFHENLSILFKSLEFLLIGYFLSLELLGEYRAVYNLVFPLFIIPVIISQVLLSQLSKHTNNTIIMQRIFMKFMKYTTLLSFIFVGIYLVFDSYIFELVYAQQYGNATDYYLLYIFLFAMVVYFIKSNVEVYMTALGLQKERVRILKIAVIFFVFLSFLFSYGFGIIGFALSMLFVNIIMLFFQYKTILLKNL